ncbi:MAG: DUF3098 domain-containing protein [Bacteroidales bacterium]|nr:DUF3098 domain-containing protein [Bacteroidales bacterium]
MEKNDFAFGKRNYLLMAVSVVLLILGFVLMSGGGSTNPDVFNPEIFSSVRIKVAPLIVMIGFVLMVFAILIKNRDRQEANNSAK